MYEGWIFPFRHGTEISQSERSRHLSIDRPQAISDNQASLIRFNSTYIEMVDRRFRQRGMLLTCLSLLAVLVFVGAWIYLVFDSVSVRADGEASGFDGFFVFVSLVLAAGVVVVSKLVLLKDFFTFTHYPVRFDRKARMVHAFLGRRDGGPVSVRWDDAFFHVGWSGEGDDRLSDIRCHVVDAQGSIVRTFAVGHCFDDEAKVLAEWEFIRRYMEDGPADVFERPQVDAAVYGRDFAVRTRRIDLSVVPSLRNSFYWVVLAMPQAWFDARLWLAPLYSPLFLCRWLVMKSCRAPRWPPVIEAQAIVEPGDPARLPEPSVHAQWIDATASR